MRGYSPEQRAEAVAAVIAGLRKGIPLTVICSAEGMPCDDTIRIWAEEDEALSRAIARARVTGFDTIAMEALAIQDEAPATYMTEFGPKIDPAGVQHQRNRFDGRMKLLAKWDPKRYGELLKLGDPSGETLKLIVSSEDAAL